jgi:hypothetical protein
MPRSIQTHFQGAALAFQKALDSQLMLILAAIVTVYIVLGVLYESYIHPITILSTLPSAGIGALLALMIAGDDLSVVAIIGIVLLIGIVKKNAIMMIDFALDAERNEGKAPQEAIHQACLLRFPADPDDDDRGAGRRAAADGRQRHRLGAAPSARPHHRRRPDRQPDADALHHAGDLPAFDRLGRRLRGVPLDTPAYPRAAAQGDGPGPRRAARGLSAVMSLSSPFIARPVATTLLTLGVLLAGILGFMRLPVAPLPKIDFPTISVSASLPGASPDTVATSVTTPLERGWARSPGHRDHLDQHGRQFAHHPAVRPVALDRRGGARRAGGDQRRPRRPAVGPAQQSAVSQGQSGRRAGTHPGADLRDDGSGPPL